MGPRMKGEVKGWQQLNGGKRDGGAGITPSPIIPSQPLFKTKSEVDHKHNTHDTHNTSTTRKQGKQRKRKMSWQTYVDEHLMCDIDGTGHHLSASAIVGHDGSVWAQSSTFPQVYISSPHSFLSIIRIPHACMDLPSIHCITHINIAFYFY